MWTYVITACWWAAAGLMLLWAASRWAGWERGELFVPLTAFTPYVAGVSVVVVAAALLRRRWRVAVAAGLACAALVVAVAPRAVGSPSTMDGVTVRVMSANLLAGGADPATIVALVRENNVDVLALQEFTPEAERRLADAGLDQILGYGSRHAVPGVGGSAVYTRFPAHEAGVRENPYYFTQVRVRVQAPGANEFWVESVHPPAPTPGAVAGWHKGLRNQPTADPAGPPRVLIGDFNATLDHTELRRVLDSGYRDAADLVGAGLVPTWPYFGKKASAVPKVTIDHVLVDPRIGVTDFTATTVPASDHRAIIATLLLPKAAR